MYVYISHMILIHWFFQTWTEKNWNDWSFHLYPPGCIFWIYSYNVIRNKYFWNLHPVRLLCYLFYTNFICSVCFRSIKTFSCSDKLVPMKTVYLGNHLTVTMRGGAVERKAANWQESKSFPWKNASGTCLLAECIRHSWWDSVFITNGKDSK